MRIVFLAHNLIRQGGLICGQNFINALVRSNCDHKYLITIPQNCGYENIILPKGNRYHICLPTNTLSILQRFKLEMQMIPSVVQEFKADVLMALGNHGLMDINCPQAIWVQNGYLVYPYKHFASASMRIKIHTLFQRIHFARTLRKTGLLFCQTPIMKKRIADYYKFSESRIEILPNVISEFVAETKQTIDCVPAGVDKSKFNCLILSKYYVHKNPEVIMEACEKYEEELCDVKFITTISKSDHAKAAVFLKKLTKEPKLSSKICNVGPIPHHRISNYYNNVQLVIMPTYIESFSITYLEAMNFGVPILTTDLDFAHYLCGDAASYYKPWDIEDFVRRLVELKYDVSKRQQIVENAKMQLSYFSSTWDDMVKVVISSLEKLASN